MGSTHGPLSRCRTICVSIAQPVFRKDCSLPPHREGVVGWERSSCLVCSSLRHIQYGMSVAHVQVIRRRISQAPVLPWIETPCSARGLLDCYKFIKYSTSLLKVLHEIENGIGQYKPASCAKAKRMPTMASLPLRRSARSQRVSYSGRIGQARSSGKL